MYVVPQLQAVERRLIFQISSFSSLVTKHTRLLAIALINVCKILRMHQNYFGLCYIVSFVFSEVEMKMEKGFEFFVIEKET